MITTKQQSRLIEKIKSMSELELESFFEEVAEYFEKNNLIHVIEGKFYLEKTQGLEADLDELRADYESLELEKEELEENAERAIELLDTLDKDDFDGDIDRIINVLS